jgi:hypothetical protein
MFEYIERTIEKWVREDLERKMVFIGGPRQTGKTTLAKEICRRAGCDAKTRYLTWDAAEDRENIIRERFPAGPGLLILDEIHKYSRWRQIVKGLFDKRGADLKIMVTGSARLDYYRRGGDSLQGRYHFFRLFPFTLAEVGIQGPGALPALFKYGGFPEPFLMKSERESRRWSREYRTRVIRDDLADLENVQDLGLIENLALRLPDLVGAPLSLNSLREDLQVSHQSVARWIGMLENLYLVFRIYPFGAPKIRAVKKEAKLYMLDWNLVSDRGSRFENLVACHLLKWCFFLQDVEGRDVELRYFRDIDRREVDFVIVENRKPTFFLECKTSDKGPSVSLKYLKKRFPQVDAVQILLEGDGDFRTKEGIRVCSAEGLLSEMV